MRACRQIYRFWLWLGAGRKTCVLLVTGIALLFGYAYHVEHGFPSPRVHDEFSYLLGADTFASGRLTNPPHPLWQYFESMHIIQQPTYASIYPVGQALVLAAGQRIAGHPWWGVWFSVGLMCGAICWALQQWLPPQWALVGALLSLRLSSSYWLSSYWGGAVAAIGGALLVGAAARMLRRPSALWAFLMALGIVIVGNTRPYEGLVLTLCVGAWVLVRLAKMPKAGRMLVVRRAIGPFAVVFLAVGGWMAYYNMRVTGSATTTPYQISFRTYLYRRMFVWQKNRPKPAYRYPEMRNAYRALERNERPRLYFARVKFLRPFNRYFWAPLLPLALLVPLGWRSRRARPLIVFSGILLLALALEEWVNPHYTAPFAAVLYAVMIQPLRRIHAWGKAGLVAAQAIVVVAIGVNFAQYAVRCLAPLELGWQDDRERIEHQLEATPGQDLVIVRYSGAHDPYDEWVYNRADIDRAPVVWARDVIPPQQEPLLRYFAKRRVWILEADAALRPVLRPYTPEAYAPGGRPVS
ncbi:MAG TPA: hypothetical protein VHA11_09045 [Bryobacteraceae bacterium]|nr:hypothetical protein [Bryobacteraceae bacterium]